MDRLEIDGRTVALEAHPIGIVTDEWERLVTADVAVARGSRAASSAIAAGDSSSPSIASTTRRGSPSGCGRSGASSSAAPSGAAGSRCVQVAVPSRERVPAYAELRREVSELVGEINGELGTPDWSPVIYLRRSISRVELAALYAAADVGWVAPLRDGMNLVAKEYVACQQGRAGVLLLSEFAGAAREMGEAIRVNPYDEPGSADALERALAMPEDERRERQAALPRAGPAEQRHHLGRALRRRPREPRSAGARRRGHRGSRASAAGDSAGPSAAPPGGLSTSTTTGRSCRSQPPGGRHAGPVGARDRRRARPAQGHHRGHRLGAVSRRPRALVRRPAGRLAGGRARRAASGDPETRQWQPLRPGADVEWKARVRPILEHFADRAPGSLVEEKEFALGWHFRQVEPEFGDWLANEVAATLDQQLAGTELAVLRGSKVVEVRFAWANKGEVAARLRALGEAPDFELAIGDDRTDEDLFERLPGEAWTIRVGPGATRARFRVPRPAAALAILAALGPPSLRAGR